MAEGRTGIFLLFIAILLIGLGRIALMPPFAGIDETAHYSRIKAEAYPLADEKKNRTIARDVRAYTQQGPMSPGWVENPFTIRGDDSSSKNTYADYYKFFDSPARIAVYEKAYKNSAAPKDFEPSAQNNWEYQHPGLYYALSARLYRLMTPMPLADELFILRAVNFLMACAGLAIGVAATARHLGRTNGVVAFGMFYPFMMPVFFMDLARLGNDDLCLFLFGITWAFLLWHLRAPGEKLVWLFLGLGMGLGCLAKATMIPVSAGILIFLCGYHARRGGGIRRFLSIPAIAAMAALTGCKGYLSLLGSGRYPGDAVFIDGAKTGHLFPWHVFFSNIFDTAISTSLYFIDWFIVPIPLVYVALCLLPLALCKLSYLREIIRGKNLFTVETLPLWVLGPLVGALMLHSAFSAAALGAATFSPGYYVHILAPALALLCGTGLAAMAEKKALVRTLLAMSLISTTFYMAAQAVFYAGCKWHLPDKNKPPAAFDACVHSLFARLDVLAFPRLGAFCIVLGFACAVAGYLASTTSQK